MRSSERPSRPRSSGWVGLVPAVLALILVGCGGLPRPADGPARQETPRPAPIAPQEADATVAIAQEMLDRHNQLRTEHDLPPLSLSPKLSEAAGSQVAGMIELGKISHEGADGSTPADRVRRQDYPFTNVGENVASGQETAEEVMDIWMNSPGHRRNILGDFEQMGASLGEDADGFPYWCVVFATPLPQFDPARAATDLLGLINGRRAEESLPPLQAGDPLMGVARDHARAMAEAGSLDPEGFSYLDALKRAGVGYRRVALGVSTGQPTASAVLDSFADDDRLRGTLLGDFDRVGIGYATDQGGRPYWSVIVVKTPGR